MIGFQTTFKIYASLLNNLFFFQLSKPEQVIVENFQYTEKYKNKNDL